MKKKVVVALGHRALGTTLPEQMVAVHKSAKAIADLIEDGYDVAITHSNAPQVGMIHTAMNEFGKAHQDYTSAPMSVCSAMSQGYIGYDLQNALREELLDRGIYRTVSTILSQVIVDPYDDAFYTPTKVLGRYMNAEEANEERKKGNFVVEEAGKGFRRIVAAPNPVKIVEIDAINALLDAGQIVIACGGGGIPVLEQDHHLRGASAVIEKDLAAGKLAEGVDADLLIILTNVEQVCINDLYGRGPFRHLQHAPEIPGFCRISGGKTGPSGTDHFFRQIKRQLKRKNRNLDFIIQAPAFFLYQEFIFSGLPPEFFFLFKHLIQPVCHLLESFFIKRKLPVYFLIIRCLLHTKRLRIYISLDLLLLCRQIKTHPLIASGIRHFIQLSVYDFSVNHYFLLLPRLLAPGSFLYPVLFPPWHILSVFGTWDLFCLVFPFYSISHAPVLPRDASRSYGSEFPLSSPASLLL